VSGGEVKSEIKKVEISLIGKGNLFGEECL
jgi:hypothetical protein